MDSATSELIVSKSLPLFFIKSANFPSHFPPHNNFKFGSLATSELIVSKYSPLFLVKSTIFTDRPALSTSELIVAQDFSQIQFCICFLRTKIISSKHFYKKINSQNLFDYSKCQRDKLIKQNSAAKIKYTTTTTLQLIFFTKRSHIQAAHRRITRFNLNNITTTD